MYQYVALRITLITWYYIVEPGASSTQGAVVELLLADKETRGLNYYQVFIFYPKLLSRFMVYACTLWLCLRLMMFQVLWLGMPDLHVTWEPASSLPTEAIEEYEKGIVSTPVQQSSINLWM